MSELSYLELILDEYLESLQAYGSEDLGFCYLGDSMLIEDLLWEFGYDVKDLQADAQPELK